ncbi:unnamed protein product [Thlaspi arvense]|uniref:NB-ARC domain-containing protein n=1 Tax=Thlaspi arvense TaxID=13288 RepID=A0AAU9T7W9_THLAR|nr:unnamed protein product [Thlaspi arvense]
MVPMNHRCVSSNAMKRRLRGKNVLNDVDDIQQLQELAGNCNWFGPGSRIIITSRGKRVLEEHNVKHIYEVKLKISDLLLEVVVDIALGNGPEQYSLPKMVMADEVLDNLIVAYVVNLVAKTIFLNLFCKSLTVLASIWKALARTFGSIAGLDPNTVLAIVITPAFWLLKAAIATAGVRPRLNWKWMSPSGNTNTSPTLSVLAKRRFPSWFDEINPTSKVPCCTTKISVARGEIPRVFYPPRLLTLTVVTLEPTALFTFPALLSPGKKKSSVETILGSLQNFPFTNTEHSIRI